MRFHLTLFFGLSSIQGFAEPLQVQDQARLLTEIEMLDKVPVDSNLFVDAIDRQMRLFYRLEQWDRLFASAQFYRFRVLTAAPSKFRQSLVALEILALTKHCAWEQAQKLADWGVQLARSQGTSSELIVRAKSLLQLHQHFPEEGIPTQWSAAPSAVFSEWKHWKVEADVFKRAAHPKLLRVFVADRCQVEGSG